jgi:peroxiredoxin
MSEVRSTFRLRPGDPAPAFDLPDATGQPTRSDQAVGPQGLIVAFVCNHCPFVIHLADALGAFAGECLSLGIHTVAINSNDADRYPDDAPAMMAPFAAAHGWRFPYLIDASQQTALAYGAACTPDFFLFDRHGRLFYSGQFDGTRPRRGLPDGSDMRNAVQRMLADQTPPDPAWPSSGCNIKWKPSNRPDWWESGNA